MYLVKIGGSVITDKSRYRVFRQKAVAEILHELSLTGESFAVVHGGGSFGHIKAREYGLPGPMDGKGALGYSIVHRDMVDLNQKIVHIMVNMGFRAVGIPPALYFNRMDEITKVFLEYAQRGFMPVTFGDVYLEGDRIGIVSGDDLMVELARALKPERVVFFTDVDGIYDRNPKKTRGAKLLPLLDGSAKYEETGTDVTGGMGKKASSILDIAALGATVYVLNGNVPSRIHSIGKEGFVGTVVK